MSSTLARKFRFDLGLAACGLLVALAACLGGGVRRGGGRPAVVPESRAATQAEAQTDPYAGTMPWLTLSHSATMT
jgi:hypothetical protein